MGSGHILELLYELPRCGGRHDVVVIIVVVVLPKTSLFINAARVGVHGI